MVIFIYVLTMFAHRGYCKSADFIADGFLSARVLRRGGNVDLMSLPRLIRALSH